MVAKRTFNRISLAGWLSAVICFTACSGNHTGGNSVSVSNGQHINAIAWNEDTVNTAYIELERSGDFTYTFVDRSKEPVARTTYVGNYSIASDTIRLTYRKAKSPIDLAYYLLISTDGHYWFQNFVTNEKRIFLRINSFFQR